MTRRVRHIWAKANQHIKVHRARPQPNGGKDGDNTIFIIIAVIVFIWIII